MQIYRLNRKRISIWIILLVQLILIASYFYLQDNLTNQTDLVNNKVSFIVQSAVGTQQSNYTYLTRKSKVILKYFNTRDSFIDFNTSLCYINGTNLSLMNRNKNFNWICQCLPGWHGSDCAQPEIVWRAFLAYHKPISIKGPRKYQRRIIYVLRISEYSQTIAEIKINELKNVVDLFVLCENKSDYFLENKLRNKYLNEVHNKILYLKESNNMRLWSTIKKTVRNLRDDDIVLTNDSNDILNRRALEYFKFYDKWPEPINFRLKWLVYGFFWMHPTKTVLTGGACTVTYLQENLSSNISLLNDNKTIMNPLSKKSFIIGDLNHYGGWFCEYCNDPSEILNHLANKPSKDLLHDKTKIDTSYVEDLIENGIYLDGKTELRRVRRYQDNYYAPTYVNDNNWKYDNLFINLYSKLDYY